MVYRTIIHLNIELQIPVIYRADFGLRGFTPLRSFCGKGEGWDPAKRFDHISLVAAVSPIARLKSFCSCCFNRIFWWRCAVTLLNKIFHLCREFWHIHGGNRPRRNGLESRVLSCFQFGWTYNFHLFFHQYTQMNWNTKKNICAF